MGGGCQASPPHRQVGGDRGRRGVHCELIHLEHLWGDGELRGEGVEESGGDVDGRLLQDLLGGVSLLGGELQQVPVAVLQLLRHGGGADGRHQEQPGEQRHWQPVFHIFAHFQLKQSTIFRCPGQVEHWRESSWLGRWFWLAPCLGFPLPALEKSKTGKTLLMDWKGWISPFTFN